MVTGNPMNDDEMMARETEAAALLGGWTPGDDCESDGGTRAIVLPAASIPAGALPASRDVSVKRIGDMGGAPLTDAASRFGRARPGDIRYHTPEAFAAAMRDVRDRARESIVDLRSLRCVAQDASSTANPVAMDVAIVGPAGVPATMTHHAFGQLCQRVDAPPAFLRELPAELAADVLSDRLSAADRDRETGLLFAQHGNSGPVVLRAATGPKYGRVWNADVAAAAAETGSRAGFSAPVAFRSSARHAGRGDLAQTPGTTATEHALPCAVANDRDAFLFLVDYDAQIRVPGYDAPLFRGFFLSNSEVGAGSLVWTGFLLDGVCCNLNVWGAKEVTEIRLRHTAGIHERTPALYDAARSLSSASAADDEARIRACQRALVADTHAAVVSKLQGMNLPGVTKAVAAAAVDVAASTPRYGDPRSVWAVGNGLTEVSQRQAHVGDRATIDRSAGRVFRMAF